MNYIVLFNVPYDAWEVMLVTNDIEKSIDKIRTTKANCIQIWDNENLIDDFNFTEECDWDSTNEYQKALSEDIFKFMELISKINNKKFSSMELKYAKEKLINKGNKLKIGIVLKNRDDENIINQFKNIVKLHSGEDEILNSKITKYSGKIETNTTIYELIKTETGYVRGTKFNKVFHDDCPNNILNEVIKSLIDTSENLGIHNTIEKL
jgi:hypothetical protein